MEYPDLDLRPSEERPVAALAEPRRRPIVPVLAAALVLAAIGGGVYFLYRGRDASGERPVEEASVAVPPVTPAGPLGGQVEAIDLPPLAQSDAVVRQMLSALSSDPRFLAWLATDGLIRTFTTVVVNIADGETPARHLPLMRPLSGFRVSDRDGELVIDPRSYARYNSVADAVASIDAAGSAQLYATLKPRIDEAYRELGYPDTPFDRTLERAIVTLLETPVPGDIVRVGVSGGVAYAFADPALENLNAAQRQLLRTGPRNVRVIQTALRALAEALGIPPERLPPPA